MDFPVAFGNLFDRRKLEAVDSTCQRLASPASCSPHQLRFSCHVWYAVHGLRPFSFDDRRDRRSPASTAITLLTARSAIAVRVSVVPLPGAAPAAHSRDASARGGCPARLRNVERRPGNQASPSAHASAASSTTGPRAVFTRYAERRMRVSASPIDQMSFPEVNGTCSDTTSDVFSSRSRTSLSRLGQSFGRRLV